MIISRTPFRISFFGGGTDYPSWYREHGGAVLSATIDKYCHLACRYYPPFFEYRYRVVWSKIESCNTIDEIEHPAVREVLRDLAISKGVEVQHIGDLPARSGMGSSSAFTVGLLNAMHALRGQMVTKQVLAERSIYIEQNVLKEEVGSQDQISAAFGGFNYISFLQDGSFSVRPVTISEQRRGLLNDHLMLLYTGIKRTAATVAATYARDPGSRKRQLRILRDLAEEGIGILGSNVPMERFGELLHEGWMVKSSLSQSVSNPQIEAIYETARRHGAIGGKLLGAGGGGFFLLFAPPERQAEIRAAFPDLVHVPFQFEPTGSQIIFFSDDVDYSSTHQERDRQMISAFRELDTLPVRLPGQSAA